MCVFSHLCVHPASVRKTSLFLACLRLFSAPEVRSVNEGVGALGADNKSSTPPINTDRDGGSCAVIGW